MFGELTQGRALGMNPRYGFRAFAARMSAWRSGVKIMSQVCACSICGLVWGQIAPNKLIEHIRRFATDEAEDWLRSEKNTAL